MEIKEIPIGKIKRDPKQPRTNFDPAAIAEMAQSILTEGVINPIEVDKSLTIVTGEMRWRASKKAGLKTIPAKIININPDVRFRRQVIENVHHNTMTEMDTAKALKKLLPTVFVDAASTKDGKLNRGAVENKGYKALGVVIGKDPRWVTRYFSFLSASPQFHKAVKKGTSLTYIDVINATPDQFKDRMEEKIIEGEFGTRDGARVVVQALKARPDKAPELLEKDYRDMQTSKIAQEVYKIVPDFSPTPMEDAIDKAFQPSEEITKAALKLKELLEKYPVTDMGPLNIPRVALALAALEREMTRWLLKSPSKQLTA
jgi:ParB family chromosome partitioning protein